MPNNIKLVEKELEPKNWQYFNCMLGEFRHNVANHHDLGWENMTKEYYESLKMMSDEEIKDFNKNNPVEFDNGFMKHGYHRGYAMIGRLINGKPYIPLYMDKEKIYNIPWKNDNKIRTPNPLNNIKSINDKNIKLKQNLWNGLNETDLILYIIDIKKYNFDEIDTNIKKLYEINKPIVIVFNKNDLIEKNVVLHKIKELNKKFQL